MAGVNRPTSVWILKYDFYVSFIEHSKNVSYGKAPNGNVIKSPCLDWRNTSAICFFTLLLGHLRWVSLASYTETPAGPSLSLSHRSGSRERVSERG